jgi:hypothetical protein
MSWDPHTLTMSVFAVRKLKKGDEITVAYTDILDIRSERLRRLNLLYGFDCSCEKCALGDVAARNSDGQRKQLRLWATSGDRLVYRPWTDASTRQATKAQMQKDETELSDLLKIIGAEGLSALRSLTMELTDKLLRVHVALGDEKKASGALRMAKNAWALDPFASASTRQHLALYEEWGKNISGIPGWSSCTK